VAREGKRGGIGFLVHMPRKKGGSKDLGKEGCMPHGGGGRRGLGIYVNIKLGQGVQHNPRKKGCANNFKRRGEGKGSLSYRQRKGKDPQDDTRAKVFGSGPKGGGDLEIVVGGRIYLAKVAKMAWGETKMRGSHRRGWVKAEQQLLCYGNINVGRRRR